METRKDGMYLSKTLMGAIRLADEPPHPLGGGGPREGFSLSQAGCLVGACAEDGPVGGAGGECACYGGLGSAVLYGDLALARLATQLLD